MSLQRSDAVTAGAATGDPQLSLDDRKRFHETCLDLQKQRYLLAEDVERLDTSRDKVRPLFETGKGVQ